MAINYPTSLDALTNPTGADTLATTPHSTLHSDERDAIEALEAKNGITGSAVTTSDDYRLGKLEASVPPALVNGFKQWSWDLGTAPGSTRQTVSGTLYLVKFLAQRSETWTNVHFNVTTGGASSVGFGCLYTAAGARLSNASSGVATSANGLKTFPLATPTAVVAGTLYYVGFWTTTGTQPTIERHQGGAGGTPFSGNLNLAIPNLRFCTADTSLTTSAPANFGTQTANADALWVAVT